ncbi:YfgM family protein [Vibrio caribbeanicus]|uniref:YfgM family protein n=1 Tax=Vibrio caribbeanicus TaxID=701175 RepID=UPI00228472D2|nr:YfgM family protein [Vibrio caribbeanicus]MCY9844757.1 YfgM family protein [Vibrio caribbeanicus]
MELYDTEEQQIERIKELWNEYGKVIVASAVIGLGGLFGWNQYQDSIIATQEATSDSYVAVIEELADKGVSAANDVQTFIDDNQKTQYSVLAALQLAKLQVEAGNLDEALAQLEWAKSATQDTAISAVILHRLARLKLEQGNYDAALAELNLVKDQGWAGRVAELKGDIFLRQGNTEAAYTAYTEAQQDGDASQTLQMKLDDLAQ